MKTLLVTAILALSAATAFAQSPTCKSKAADQKLAGAALTSFMKKCEGDAKKSCEADAAKNKLSGAAKNSHVKKCVGDAVGT